MSVTRDRLRLRPPETTNVKSAMGYFRESIISLGEEIEASLPDCRERSLALTALEEVCFWTIGTIARNQTHWDSEGAT